MFPMWFVDWFTSCFLLLLATTQNFATVAAILLEKSERKKHSTDQICLAMGIRTYSKLLVVAELDSLRLGISGPTWW